MSHLSYIGVARLAELGSESTNASQLQLGLTLTFGDRVNWPPLE